MIIEIRAKNCFVYDEQISLSMKADMRFKNFSFNVHRENNFNVLKTVGIFAQNNAGKTCLIKCINAIKSVLLNKSNLYLKSNIFSNNKICELGVTFLHNGKKYSYDFKYNHVKKEYVYESFSEILKDQYNNEKEDCLFKRDTLSDNYQCKDKELKQMIPVISKNNLMIHLIDTRSFETLDQIKKILIGFAEKIDVVNMNNIPISHTIELMKNKGNLQKKIVNFIKQADLYMDDYAYVDMKNIKIKGEDGENKPDEEVLDIPDQIMDQIRLVSTYKGKSVPSLLFDSTGTKKIAALASYVIEALEKGRILIIDELDSSLHFKLTRAIVALFNNELNTNSQLIFSAHDINLMDCKRLFRKEQIWFIYKDVNSVYLYSLADFTAEDGIRDTSDIIEKYRKGTFATLPEPDFMQSLLDINNNKANKDVK